MDIRWSAEAITAENTVSRDPLRAAEEALAKAPCKKRWMMFPVADEPVDEDESAVEEVESEVKARRCGRFGCDRVVPYLRALHGREYCSARCSNMTKRKRK